MNTKILTLAAVGAALVATSCDNWTPPTGSTGEVALSTMTLVNDDAEKLVQNSSRAEASLDDYIVSIYQAGNTAEPVKTYTYGAMPEVVTLEAGSYRIDVKSHEVQKAEWDRPYFVGSSKDFAVEAAKITNVGEIVAKFSSIKVTLKYSEALQTIMGSDVEVEVKVNDAGVLVYTPAETRAGYFEAVEGSNTMVATLTGTIAGVKSSSVFTFDNAAAGQHHIITLDVRNAPTPPEQTGTVNPGGITIDAGIVAEDVEGNVVVDEEVIEGERPWGPEEPEPGSGPDPGPGPDDPKVEAATFSSPTLTDLEAVYNPADLVGKECKVFINCPKGVKDLVVTINSEKLEPMLPAVGLSTSFSLAYPADDELAAALKNDFKFKIRDEIINHTEVEFDITEFVPLLTNFAGDHTFVLDVTDNEDAKSQLELKFHAD